MSLIDFSLQCGRLWKNAGKSADQIQTESIAAFRRMLEHAWKNTRFYPAFWGRSGICYEDLRVIEPGDIPCITKEDVRKNYADFSTVSLRKDRTGEWIPKKKAAVIHSSGSTGIPLQFLYSRRAMTMVEANFVRLSNLGGKKRVGWRNLPIRNIHAASVGEGYASALLLTDGLSRYHAKCIVLNASEPLAEWVEKTGDFCPNFLSGYPSCLAMLLDLQKEGKIDLHPLKVITGGEPLKEDLKMELEKCFDADVIDYYGCCESLMVGAGSSWYQGMYLFDDMNYAEVDDKGHLILTPLYNPLFPLIRYRLDDLVEGFSRTGRGELPFTHIDRILGRDEDILWFRNEDGNPDFLHPLVLDDLNVKGLTSYQFIQKNDELFYVDCIMESSDPAIEGEIRRQLDEMLRHKKMQNVHYEIIHRSRLQRNPKSGKIPLTIRQKESGR